MRLHPADAEAAGLADGDRAELASEHGAMTAVVALDANVRAGVVSVTHSRVDPAARAGSPAAPTDVDPLTGMPLASGLPVSIRPPSSG